MMDALYQRLEDVFQDAVFPDVDLALRRGRHVDLDDSEWFALLTEAQPLLETFYRRYGCELVRAAAGFFYLRIPLKSITDSGKPIALDPR